MPDDSPNISPASTSPVVQPRQLRRWFVAGFLLVFVGMLILMNQYVYTGGDLVQCKLWQYYLIETQSSFTSSDAIGPTTGLGTHASMTLLQHLAISGAGGLISLGIRTLITRNRAQ